MSDANWSNRRLLLHFDGSNGSTTFTDSSDDARTVTAVGTAALTTSASKWGTASLSLSGVAGNRATVASMPAFAGDFTIEGWVYLLAAGAGASRAFFTAPPYEIYRVSSGTLRIYKDGSGTILTGNTLPTEQWVHIAVSRSGTQMRLFMDGVLQSAAITETATIPSGTRHIGSYSDGTECWQGYIDDLRVSDRAEYTAGFSVPTAAYPDVVTVSGRLSLPGPLESPALLGGQWLGRLSVDGPLGAPAMLGVQSFGHLSIDGPLGAPALVGVQRYGYLQLDGPLSSPALVGHQQIGHLSIQGPLGDPALLASQRFGSLTLDGPLGAPALLAQFPVVGQLSIAGPLGDPALLAWHDFTGAVSETSTLAYVMDLIGPGGTVRVPISSWQATLQTDAACYVQCVVPACLEWVETIAAATAFVIYRRADLTDGGTIEYEMARAPLDTRQYAQGGRNYSATLSGYTDALTANASPPTAYDRTLSGVRTVFDGDGGMRVTADIDWLLRPGMRAYFGETPILVDYINYYVPGSDQYMIVGERA